MKFSQKLSLANASRFQRQSRQHVASPVALFCRRMIETALEDAVMVRNGRVAWEAALAQEWLTATPSRLNREEYICSFRWCCEWLDMDPDERIAAALPIIHQTVAERIAQQTAPISEQITRLEHALAPHRHKAVENPAQTDLFAVSIELADRAEVTAC